MWVVVRWWFMLRGVPPSEFVLFSLMLSTCVGVLYSVLHVHVLVSLRIVWWLE